MANWPSPLILISSNPPKPVAAGSGISSTVELLVNGALMTAAKCPKGAATRAFDPSGVTIIGVAELEFGPVFGSIRT